MRVAWPRKTGSTPAANGSRVPPWPTRRTPVRRRTMATTSWEVGPMGLPTTRMPSSSGPRRRALPSAGAASASMSRVASASTASRGCIDGRVDRRTGSPRVASATERAGEHDRVDAALAGPDADACLVALIPEQDGDVTALLDCASRSMMPSDMAGPAPAAVRSVRLQRRPDQSAVRGGLEPGQDEAEELAAARWAWCGRAAARCPPAAHRRRAAPRPPAAFGAWRWGAGRWRCRPRRPPSGAPRWHRRRRRWARPGGAAAA